MADFFDWVRRMLLFAAIGIAAMTVLVTGVALLRDTTGHDWYAARKLTVTEVMIAADSHQRSRRFSLKVATDSHHGSHPRAERGITLLSAVPP